MLVVVLLTGVSSMAQGSFKSVDVLTEAWEKMEARSGEIARTEVEVVGTTDSASDVYVTLRNTGQTELRNFRYWDVFVQYYKNGAGLTFQQRRLSYVATSPPGNNEWTVEGIYVDAGSLAQEEYQPGIFDPGEEMVIQMIISPNQDQSIAGHAIIGVDNGVTISTLF